MKISIVTGPWLPVPALQGGSVPRMWHGLAEEFAARGHDVIVLPRRFPGQPDSETTNGVRYLRLGGFAQGGSIYADLVKDFFYAAGIVGCLPAADILVVNDFWLPVLAGIFRRRAGLMVVSANRFPKRQYALYRRVARVAAASRAIEQAIVAQTPALAPRVRCLPNPFDTRIFVPPADGRAGRAGRTILYVGRIHPEKGVAALVTAFARVSGKFPDANLRLVGPSRTEQGGGGEKFLRELQTLAAGAPVTFSEPEFDVAKLAAIYQAADLFCYPSLAEKGEALPVAPLEAMSTGLPVVVSALECFHDFVVEGRTGLSFNHRAGDPADALAAKLEAALADWPRTLALGGAAREAAQRFGFARVADEFLADFAALLAAK
ncbi:MAG: glycosyltransferase family 4 protein [Verrucomicrobia bacterium]|nr:glycosyltransferase family 4 protein [Verrucomicrobiota bacterium]